MASFALALLPPAVYYFVSQKPTPVQLMHGQLMNRLGPVTRAPLHYDPGTKPLQTSQPPNLTLNCFGNAMCTAPFTPLPKKKSTFHVPDSAYKQPLKAVVKRGVIQTLAGPIDDYVSVMPPPTGNYHQATNGRLKHLQGNAAKLKRKKDVSFCAVGEAENFVEPSVYKAAHKRQLENKDFLLNDLQPCNTGMHETLYDRKVSGGHGMSRFVPAMPYTTKVSYRHTGNSQAVVDAQMARQLKVKCHSGEVRSNHQGAADGLVKQAFLHKDSQSKGFDVEEVYLNRKNHKQANVLKASKVDSQTSRTSHSETSVQTNRHLDIDFRKGMDTDVASNQLEHTGKRTARFGNFEMTKKNPLYNQQHRSVNRAKRHTVHQTFQADVVASSKKPSRQNRIRDSTMRVSSRQPAPSLTDAFTGNGYVAGESGVDYSNEQTFTRANPLYYSKFRMGSEGSSRQATGESQFANDVKTYAKSGIAYNGEVRSPSCD